MGSIRRKAVVTMSTLRFERPEPHIARLVLDRPEVANALDSRLLRELTEAVEAIAADDDIRVWLLTGAPRPDGRPWFSAGHDLKEPLGGPAVPHVDGGKLMDRIDELLKPSIAVINGVCTTGGLELAMSCDLRVAGHSARLSDWHLRRTGLGIGGWGAAARLSRLVGVDKAKELLLLGVEVDGPTAESIGLVTRAVPDEDLEETALEMARTIASLPPRGVRTTLGYLQTQDDLSKHEAISLAGRMPELMGLKLRPFSDAAARFAKGGTDLSRRPAPLPSPTDS